MNSMYLSEIQSTAHKFLYLRKEWTTALKAISRAHLGSAFLIRRGKERTQCTLQNLRDCRTVRCQSTWVLLERSAVIFAGLWFSPTPSCRKIGSHGLNYTVRIYSSCIYYQVLNIRNVQTCKEFKSLSQKWWQLPGIKIWNAPENNSPAASPMHPKSRRGCKEDYRKVEESKAGIGLQDYVLS